MGELFHKIEQLDKCGAVDLHRDMLTVEYDTVFIIVYVWRVLEAPFAVVDGDGDDPVVFSGRMIEPSGIAFIFHAKLTFGISTCFCISGSGNGFGILFRLGQIDGNVDLSIITGDLPFLILTYPVTADVVAVLREFVKESSSCFRRYLVLFPEVCLDLSRAWEQTVHQSGVKKIPVSDAVRDQFPSDCFIQQFFQNLFQRKGWNL